MQRFLFLLLCFWTLFSHAQQKTHWTGTASYYHPKFNGRKTSSGEKFNQEKLTAASNTIKLGSRVKVTNLKNGKSVVVIVNDHMGKRNKRLIDLSFKAAKQLGFQHKGLCKVQVDLLHR